MLAIQASFTFVWTASGEGEAKNHQRDGSVHTSWKEPC